MTDTLMAVALYGLALGLSGVALWLWAIGVRNAVALARRH